MAYTKEQEAVLTKTATENGSVSFEMAEALGEQFGKSARSVIAKVKQLGLAYTPKAKPAKREKGLTKADLIAQIAENLGTNAEVLAGLNKATAKALSELVDLT